MAMSNVQQEVALTREAMRLLRQALDEKLTLAPATISPRTEQLIRLGHLFLIGHGNASTFTMALGLRVGRGNRYPVGFYQSAAGQELREVARRQAQWKTLQNRPYVTMRDDVFDGMVSFFSDRWPADLEWPASIPRPPKSKKEAA